MVLKILKSFPNFLLNYKFVTRLMQKYIQLTMLIGYFLQIVLRHSNIFFENQSAASLFLNYFKGQLEIVQYISECRLQTLET